MKRSRFFATAATIIPIAYKAAPGRFWLVNMLGISQSLVMALNTIFLAQFIDLLVEQVKLGASSYQLLLHIVIYVASIMGYQLLNSLFNYQIDIFIDVCDEKIRSVYNEIVCQIDSIEFEKNEFLDQKQKADTGRNVAKVFAFHVISIVDMVPPYLIMMAFYLSNVSPLLLLCIAIGFVPALFSLYAQRNLYSKLENTAAPLNRLIESFRNCLIGRICAKETRVLNASSFFLKKMNLESRNLCSAKLTTSQKANLIDFGINLISLCSYLLTLFLLSFSVLHGKLSAGSFYAIYSSLNQFFSMIAALVCGFIGSTIINYPAVDNFVSFIQKYSKKAESEQDNHFFGEKGIELEHVGFSYPQSEHMVLSDISLSIPPKQHVAIVGMNGAGKTTLAKILLGLYVPTTGTARIGGITITETSASEVRNNSTALFQDFVRFQMTISENVKISDLISTQNAQKVLEKVQIDDSLKSKAETLMLSKEFGGIDLSGGMWQQLGLARAAYRERELIVLDEPTSAIDPHEETRIYTFFKEMMENKTAIVISHRLGSARIADRILVMDEGKIVEDGTHNELILKDGLYKQMWDNQAQNYISGKANYVESRVKSCPN